jgi:hypothetical protein
LVELPPRFLTAPFAGLAKFLGLSKVRKSAKQISAQELVEVAKKARSSENSGAGTDYLVLVGIALLAFVLLTIDPHDPDALFKRVDGALKTQGPKEIPQRRFDEVQAILDLELVDILWRVVDHQSAGGLEQALLRATEISVQ